MKDRKDRDALKAVLAFAIGGNPMVAKIAQDIVLKITPMINDNIEPITSNLLSRRDTLKVAGFGIPAILSAIRSPYKEGEANSDTLVFSSEYNKNGVAMVINRGTNTVSAYIGQPTSYTENNAPATALLNAVEICKDQPLKLVKSDNLGKGKHIDVYEIDNLIYQPEALLLKQDLRNPAMTIPDAEKVMQDTYGQVATFGKARITIATTEDDITGVTFRISRNEEIPTIKGSDPTLIKSETVRLYPLEMNTNDTGSSYDHDTSSQRLYLRGKLNLPETNISEEGLKWQTRLGEGFEVKADGTIWDKTSNKQIPGVDWINGTWTYEFDGNPNFTIEITEKDLSATKDVDGNPTGDIDFIKRGWKWDGEIMTREELGGLPRYGNEELHHLLANQNNVDLSKRHFDETYDPLVYTYRIKEGNQYKFQYQNDQINIDVPMYNYFWYDSIVILNGEQIPTSMFTVFRIKSGESVSNDATLFRFWKDGKVSILIGDDPEIALNHEARGQSLQNYIADHWNEWYRTNRHDPNS